MPQKSKKIEFVSFTKARQSWTDTSSQVNFSDVDLIVCRHNHPYARIVRISDEEKKELRDEMIRRGVKLTKN